MRTLLLLRGAPGAGKSTWIEQNNLQNYTLEADKFRQLTSNPILGTDGQLQITQANDRRACVKANGIKTPLLPVDCL